MRAGRLRQRLILQSKATDTTSPNAARYDYGGSAVPWNTDTTVWGAIEPLSGKEYFSQQEVQSESKVRIVIRYHSGVETTWRVSHGGLYYDIEDVLNHDTRNRQITLMCSEGVREES